MAWNLAIDTFALSVVACVLREMFGSIWPSILIHMMKNGLIATVLFYQLVMDQHYYIQLYLWQDMILILMI